MTAEIVNEFARTQSMDLTTLLNCLRQDLRRELNLGPVETKLIHLRFHASAIEHE